MSAALQDIYGRRISQFLTSRRWNHALESHLIFLCPTHRALFFRLESVPLAFCVHLISLPLLLFCDTARQRMPFVRLVLHILLEPSNYALTWHSLLLLLLLLLWSSPCSCFHQCLDSRSALLLCSTELYYSKRKTTVLCGHPQKPLCSKYNNTCTSNDLDHTLIIPILLCLLCITNFAGDVMECTR